MDATKQKYNWPQLKQEFFVSDYVEVKAFFEDKYGNYSGTIRSNTTGWSKEKKDFAKDVLQRSVEQCKERRSLELSLSLDNLLDELQRRVSEPNVKDLPVRDLKNLWQIFMTLNNMPLKAHDGIAFFQRFCGG